MGFLGSFNPVNIVKSVIRNPVQAIPKAIVSGGASLVSPQISKALTPLTSTLYNPQLLPVAASLATGAPMGFNVGGFLGGIGQVLGTSSLPSLQGIGQIAGSLAPAFAQPQAVPVSQQQTLPGIARTRGQMMTKEVFEAASKLLQKVGIAPATVAGFMAATNRVLGSLAALARRTPVGTLVNVLVGVGLAVHEANTLVAWWSTKRKRRRMNAGNAKALRRAIRRLRSFDRLSTKVYSRLHLSRGSARGRGRGRRSAVVCNVCRRDPCAC